MYFFRALTDEIEHATRLGNLKEEPTNSPESINIRDYGPEPFVVNIEEEIGLESHLNSEHFLRIEQGQGIVRMGDREDDLDFEENVEDGFVILIPTGKWHKVSNTGEEPLKIYSIYASLQHPHGTVHQIKDEAMEAEENQH